LKQKPFLCCHLFIRRMNFSVICSTEISEGIPESLKPNVEKTMIPPEYILTNGTLLFRITDKNNLKKILRMGLDGVEKRTNPSLGLFATNTPSDNKT